MDKQDIKLAKKKILKCLTEEFTYGRRKDGQPLKRPKINQPIFDLKKGYQIYNGTDLEMVMDKVVLGLYFAMEDSQLLLNEIEINGKLYKETREGNK